MAKRELLHPEILRQLLRYEPETGQLFWLRRPVSMFTDGKQTAEHNCSIWNGRFAEKPALNCPDRRGYLHGHVLRVQVKAHRVVWAIMTGEWPGEIDHIDGNTANNRYRNLRDISHSENGRNLGLKKNNTTGYCGIRQSPSGRWTAHIMVGGKTVHLGTFDAKAGAAKARADANIKFGFHSNHGVKR